MIKKILLVTALASSLVACASNAALNRDYRAQLERSGCTQVTEAQGCNLNMSREWNARHGFGNDNEYRNDDRGRHGHHGNRDHDRDNDSGDTVSRREVVQFLRDSVYDQNVLDARQALYGFGCERLGNDHWRKDNWEINLRSSGGRVVDGNVRHF